MSNQIKNSISQKGFLIMLSIIMMACNSKNKQDVIEISNSNTPDTHVVTITKSQFESSNMQLGRITKQEFNSSVKANGMFDVPPENKATVSAYFAGYVKNITLLPGDSVKKGAVLFTLENPEYVQIQQDFLEAQSKLDYLKADYDRQQALLADNITSKKNFLKAESEYKVTLAQYQSLKKKLGLMHINPDTASETGMTSTINVLSPISGIVTSIEASKGMFLNPSDVALTVTNTSHLHLELKIFEKDLPLVKEGQPIKIHLQNNTDSIYDAKVHLINKTVHANDRTVDIHGDLLHPEDAKLFAPGMYIETDIITRSHIFDALPNEAIVNIENAFYALTKQDETTYKKVPIKVGISSNGFTQILNANDFTDKTEFVTKGAFNLITE